MDSRRFLDLARRLLADPREENWRAAAGRAYYALMLTCRDALRAWGFVPQRGENIHPFVRLRFYYGTLHELKTIGDALDNLSQLRSKADYDMHSPRFATDADAVNAVSEAAAALALLDAIETDPARRNAAIADIRARWP